MNAIVCFVFLQMLDVMTTMVGLSLGGFEINPVIRWAIAWSGSSLAGILLVKSLALPFLAWFSDEQRGRALVFCCYLFGGVVMWNFLGLMVAALGRA